MENEGRGVWVVCGLDRKISIKLGMVAHAYNPSTQKADVGG